MMSPFSNCVLTKTADVTLHVLGYELEPALTITSHTDPQQGIMVWDVIFFDSQTHAGVISSTVTTQLYDNMFCNRFIVNAC